VKEYHDKQNSKFGVDVYDSVINNMAKEAYAAAFPSIPTSLIVHEKNNPSIKAEN